MGSLGAGCTLDYESGEDSFDDGAPLTEEEQKTLEQLRGNPGLMARFQAAVEATPKHVVDRQPGATEMVDGMPPLTTREDLEMLITRLRAEFGKRFGLPNPEHNVPKPEQTSEADRCRLGQLQHEDIVAEAKAMLDAEREKNKQKAKRQDKKGKKKDAYSYERSEKGDESSESPSIRKGKGKKAKKEKKEKKAKHRDDDDGGSEKPKTKKDREKNKAEKKDKRDKKEKTPKKAKAEDTKGKAERKSTVDDAENDDPEQEEEVEEIHDDVLPGSEYESADPPELNRPVGQNNAEYNEQKLREKHKQLLEWTKMRDKKKEEEQLQRKRVDICFVIDGTHSMDRWILKVKDTVREIQDAMLKNCSQSMPPRFAVVVYRDFAEVGDKHAVNGHEEYDILNFSTAEEVEEFLAGVQAHGGYDSTEDVLGGLQQAMQLEWEAPTRIMFLISDKPQHGIENHDLGQGELTKEGGYYKIDRYHEIPDPLGQDAEIILGAVKQSADLYFLKISNDTDKMIRRFKRIYDGAEYIEDVPGHRRKLVSCDVSDPSDSKSESEKKEGKRNFMEHVLRSINESALATKHRLRQRK